jgi:hypothetical protein
MCGVMEIPHVPVISSSQMLPELDVLLKYADGKSFYNTNKLREGIVVENIDEPKISFKVISNAYLLKS